MRILALFKALAVNFAIIILYPVLLILDNEGLLEETDEEIQ